MIMRLPPVITLNRLKLPDALTTLPIKLILIALVLLLSALPALAADIIVDADDTCSFADAWLSARYNANQGGCVATGTYGDDTIILEKDVSGGNLSHYQATAGDNRSLGNLTVEGQGHTYTMTANNGLHFSLATPVGAWITINNLTLTRAAETGVSPLGGSINAVGSSTHVANVAVNNSIFYSNHTSAEGGVINVAHGNVVINKSVFYNNRSDGEGSAFHVDVGGSVTVTNSVIYNNQGRGVIAVARQPNAHDITLRHVTMFNNSSDRGAIYVVEFTAMRDLTVRNSILHNNGRGCNIASGSDVRTVTISDSSIEGDSTTHCQPPDAPLDIMLETPMNELNYLYPPVGSPAIDAVPCLMDVTDDIRGVSRPQGDNCDMGANEYQPLVAIITAKEDEDNELLWHFDASASTGRITEYEWEFGDGSTGMGKTTMHRYRSGGHLWGVFDSLQRERRK